MLKILKEAHGKTDLNNLDEAILSPEVANDVFNLGLDLKDSKSETVKLKFYELDEEKYLYLSAEHWILVFKHDMDRTKIENLEVEFYKWTVDELGDNSKICEFTKYLQSIGAFLLPWDFDRLAVEAGFHGKIVNACADSDWDLFYIYNNKAIPLLLYEVV